MNKMDSILIKLLIDIGKYLQSWISLKLILVARLCSIIGAFSMVVQFERDNSFLTLRG